MVNFKMSNNVVCAHGSSQVAPIQAKDPQNSINLLFNIEKQALQLYSALFSYLWPFPLKWNPDYTELHWDNKPWFKLALSFVTYIFMIIYGVVSLALAVGSDYFLPQQKLLVFNRFLLIIVFLILTALLVGAYYLCTEELLQSFFHSVKLVRKFENGKVNLSVYQIFLLLCFCNFTNTYFQDYLLQ